MMNFKFAASGLAATVSMSSVLLPLPLASSSSSEVAQAQENKQEQQCQLPQISVRRPPVLSDPSWTTKPEIFVQADHTDAVFSVAFSPDGKSLATGSRDGSVRLWTNLTSQKRDWSLLTSEKDRKEGLQVTAIAFAPKGSYFAAMSIFGLVRLWDLKREVLLDKTRQQFSSSSLAFSPDGKFLFSGGIQKIQRWNVSNGRLQGLAPFIDQQGINSIAFSPDGKLLASGGKERPSIDLWDLTKNRRICTFGNHLYSVTSVAFSPDGRLLASAGADSTIQIWSIQNQRVELLRTLKGHTQRVNAISFSPSGQLLLSGGRDNKVKLWRVQTGEEVYSDDGHKAEVLSVAFKPDGKGFATGSRDKTFQVFFSTSP